MKFFFLEAFSLSPASLYRWKYEICKGKERDLHPIAKPLRSSTRLRGSQGNEWPDKRTHGSQGPWKQNQQEEAIPVCIWCLALSDLWSPSVCPLLTRNGQMGEYFLMAQESCIITSAPHYWGDKSWVCQCIQLFWNSTMLLERVFSAEDCQEYQTLEMEKLSYWLINNKNWKQVPLRNMVQA